MEQTDRQTDKSTRFAFTAFEGQWYLFERISDYATTVAEWGWQTELTKEGRPHFQGFIRMKRQFRLSGVRKLFPGVHVEIARDWNKLRNYCRKVESAVDGTRVHVVNNFENWSMERTLVELSYHVHDALVLALEKKLTGAAYDKFIFWYCVKEILRDEPARCSQLAIPVVERMFNNTRHLWEGEETRALVLQPAQAPGVPAEETAASSSVTELKPNELV